PLREPPSTADGPRHELGPLAPGKAVRASKSLPPPLVLPLTLTRFFGREADLEEIGRRLCGASGSQAGNGAHSRLVTLTGAGGSGKTRLSVEAARRITSHFTGGAYFVPLADISNAAAIPDSILASMRLSPQPRELPAQQVIQALNSSPDLEPLPALLVLDNLEHLLGEQAGSQDAAGSALAFIAQLLQEAPRLSVLVTSRQPLRLQGELEYPVTPLPIPARSGSPEALMDCSSVRLYTERAQAVRPDFQVTSQNADAVAELCCRLEGMPLALELAAGWARVQGPAQILDRLRNDLNVLTSRQSDRPARHRSLEAAIAWSFDLLDLELQQIFCTLSMFRGGWSLQAAEQVCRRVVGRQGCGDIRLGLAELAERSLVLADTATDRFRMLETIREFASQRLQPEQKERIAAYHAQWCLAAATAPGELSLWMRSMEAERENMAAAINWAASEFGPLHEADNQLARCARVDLALRMSAALGAFWSKRGYLAEGLRLCRLALAAASSEPPQAEAAQVYCVAADLASAMGFQEEAGSLGDRGLEIYLDLGDAAGVARARQQGARIAKAVCDYTRARELGREAMQAYETAQDPDGVAATYRLLGAVAQEEGDLNESLALYQQALDHYLAAEQQESSAGVLGDMANIYSLQGDLDRAIDLGEMALEAYERAGYREAQARTLSNVGTYHQQRGDLAAAATLYKRALSITREIGERHAESNYVSNLGWIYYEMGDPEKAMELLEQALYLSRQTGHRRSEATVLNKMGCILLSL
ncbi:MAG TPA: tetratricopeptide repeat protein, partial [Chthonomonadales bacterium]|nr:tetratricopeptide repeat protein [Chthonomonadales bacterium]